MDVVIFLSVITGVSGLVLAILGYLISFKQKINLINGVDFSSLTDVAAFARDLGTSIAIMGVLMLLLSVGVFFEVIGMAAYILMIMVICAIPLPAFLIAKAKYTKRAS